MAKRRNISGRTLRQASPTNVTPADLAGNIALPRTYNDGISIANILGDVGDAIQPGITAKIENDLGLRDYTDEEIQLLFAIGMLPFAGKIAKAGMKGLNALNKASRLPAKGGFIRNPKFDWNKLTPEQKKATQQAIEEWTGRAQIHTAGRQTPPEYMTFLDDNLNDAVMNIAGDYKFTPKVAGKLNRNIKTQAIMPENTGEAAFLRHSPYVSNYDNVLNTRRINEEEARLMQAGLLPQYRADFYGPESFAKTFPTKEGPYADIGNNSKAMIIDELDRKFPGYREVMKGHGPGQSTYEKDHLYTSYLLDPTEEKIIQGKTDAILHDFPRDQLDELYKQHKNFYENEIERLQERLDYMKTEPESEQERLADLYKKLEHKQEFYIQARKALENAYNERIINDL